MNSDKRRQVICMVLIFGLCVCPNSFANMTMAPQDSTAPEGQGVPAEIANKNMEPQKTTSERPLIGSFLGGSSPLSSSDEPTPLL